MLLYLLLDATSTVAYWLIKNLGFGLYYIVSYLYNGGNLSKEDKEKKETLEMLIKQNEDIEVIKCIVDGLSVNESNDGTTESKYKSNIIKVVNDKITIKNGKYGAYISYKGGKLNVKIYGNKKPEDLTLEDCIVMINRKKAKNK